MRSNELLQSVCMDATVMTGEQILQDDLGSPDYVTGLKPDANAPVFLLSSPDRASGADPNAVNPDLVQLTATANKADRSVTIEDVNGKMLEIPETVINDFARRALLSSCLESTETTATIKVESLSGGQVQALMDNFAAVNWSTPDPQTAPNTIKQTDWNNDYQRTSQDVEDPSGVKNEDRRKSHAEWLREVDGLMEYALVEEAKNGLEATTELFEKVLVKCRGAIQSVSLTEGVGAEIYVIQAGCMARLAASQELRPYGRSGAILPHPEALDRDRHSDLFDYSIQAYKYAEAAFGDSPTDQERFLVDSGVAQALALRGKYTNETGYCSYRSAAIGVLERSKRVATLSVVVSQIDKQIQDIENGRLGYETAEHEQVPVADETLHKLVAA